MPTLEEHIAKLRRFEQVYRLELFKVLERALFDVKDQISNRVVETGKDADGQFFSNYSKGYKKIRESKGFQSKYKNFAVTNQLWNSLGITFKEDTGGAFIMVLEPIGGHDNTTLSNKELMSVLEKQEGKDILKLSKKELRLIEIAMQNAFTRLYKQIVG